MFAHVPLILGADKKRLSKRHGATSVTEYRRQGYLPNAMVNFLALLGWSPGDDRELMSIAELIESFSLEGISGGNAVFNTEKLDWMNGQYIARLSSEELLREVEPLLVGAGLLGPGARPADAWLYRLIDLLRPRAKRLTDFVELARPFLADTVEFEPEAVEKHLTSPGSPSTWRRWPRRCAPWIPSMSHMWKQRCVDRQLNGVLRLGRSSMPRGSR